MPDYAALDLSGPQFELSSPNGAFGQAAASVSGGFLLLHSEESSASGARVGSLYAQAYDATGAPVGPKTQIDSDGPGGTAPNGYDLDGLTGGGFALAYKTYDSVARTFQVKAATFDAGGNLLHTTSLGVARNGGYASVAPLSNGGFAVAWSNDPPNLQQSHLTTFDASGVQTSTTDLSAVVGPVLAVGGTDGAFVTVYFSDYAHRSLREFNGHDFEAPIVLPDTDYMQAGAALSDGRYVFVWTVSEAHDNVTDFRLYSQIYDPVSNSLVSGPATLHTADNVMYDAQVVADAHGGYVVSWNGPDYTDGAREAVAVGASGQLSDAFVLTGGLEGGFGGSKVLTLGIVQSHVHGQDYVFVPAEAAARTLTADDSPGQRLVGGSGDDVFHAGHNSVVMTGQGGADVFVFDALPWNAGHITDFTLGVDKLDFSRLFAAAGYTGSNAQQDGRVYFQQASVALADHFETDLRVYFDPDGPGGQGAFLITTLDNVGSGYSWAVVGGTAPTDPPPPDHQGQVLTSPGPNSTLAGGDGDDTLNASRGSDTLTGGAGNDVFAWGQEPWSPATVTDFQLGHDRLDLSAVFRAAGYAGTHAEADGRIVLLGQGADTLVLFDHDGPGGDWGNYVIKLAGVARDGVTWDQLAGSGATPPAQGRTINSSGPGDTLTGGDGDDTLNASRGSDVLTGAGGADRFVWAQEPWSPAEVTDFTPGTDKLDIRGLLDAAGYAGTDPFGAGYLRLIDDGAGGTKVLFDHDAGGPDPQWPNYIIHLQHVAPGQVAASDWIFQ